jgi:6-phosphogluconolactonase
MTAHRELVVHDTTAELASDVAARLADALAAARQRRGRAALALTAGSVMEQVWAALAQSGSAAERVDWSRVDVFWGDERFVAHDSSDRNDVPAQRILFGHTPFSAAVQYSMPASDGEFGDDLDAAAAGYAATLAAARRSDDEGAGPNFDVVLLGVGPDGHCCSLFPHHPGLWDNSASAIPIRDSPKPPPLRISLSFDGLNAADEIWVVVAGQEKAQAVAQALGGAESADVPSAGALGRRRTVWLLDRDAASTLPDS